MNWKLERDTLTEVPNEIARPLQSLRNFAVKERTFLQFPKTEPNQITNFNAIYHKILAKVATFAKQK